MHPNHSPQAPGPSPEIIGTFARKQRDNRRKSPKLPLKNDVNQLTSAIPGGDDFFLIFFLYSAPPPVSLRQISGRYGIEMLQIYIGRGFQLNLLVFF
jgi:hypothetical protein